jgi:hypothetical protein
MIAISNEADSGQSLEVMGKNLAREIIDFCRGSISSSPSPLTTHSLHLLPPNSEKCPYMIYESSTQGRISFIGHSVGGLIIRKCLEVKESLSLYCLQLTLSLTMMNRVLT